MSAETRIRRYRMLAALAAAAAVSGAVALPPAAKAQPYLGWDFGNGLGVGIGTPPSAYTRCPDYGWGPLYPYRCRYHRPYRAHAKPRPPAWTSPAKPSG